MEQRVEEAAYEGEEAAQAQWLREALRRGDHEEVLGLVYVIAPNVRTVRVLPTFVGVFGDALVSALWRCVPQEEREWWQALVNDPLTSVAMSAQGVDVPYLMEFYYKVMEMAVGNAIDNEQDSNYEGVADFVGYLRENGRDEPAWARYIAVEEEDGVFLTDGDGIGAWWDAAEAWDRDALLGYIECQLDEAQNSLEYGSGWWEEGWSKHAKTVHKGLSDAWKWAVMASVFPDHYSDTTTPVASVLPTAAWWRGEV